MITSQSNNYPRFSFSSANNRRQPATVVGSPILSDARGVESRHAEMESDSACTPRFSSHNELEEGGYGLASLATGRASLFSFEPILMHRPSLDGSLGLARKRLEEPFDAAERRGLPWATRIQRTSAEWYLLEMGRWVLPANRDVTARRDGHFTLSSMTGLHVYSHARAGFTPRTGAMPFDSATGLCNQGGPRPRLAA